MGSADLMPRNLYRRIEVAFPVEDADLKQRVTHEIMPAFLMDNVKARLILPTGKHSRITHKEGEPIVDSQSLLMKFASGKGRRKVKMEPLGGVEPKPVKAPVDL